MNRIKFRQQIYSTAVRTEKLLCLTTIIYACEQGTLEIIALDLKIKISLYWRIVSRTEIVVVHFLSDV